MDSNDTPYFKGRGSQIKPNNKFANKKYVSEHIEGLDEPFLENSRTEFFKENPKKIISASNSPDMPFMQSINPYQGCEHGCIYCYARNSHAYWGYSPGLDFERKIMYKPNAAQLLRQQFDQKNYKPQTIVLSGNTDCYQPAERKFQITRALLETFLAYNHPVSIITKNNLILRDLDILTQLSKQNLLHVNLSITTLNENLRQKLEPRTVTGKGRLAVINALSNAGIPVRVMVAPIIPGLNSDEVFDIIKAAADNGARAAGFTIVRLNGAIADIFKDWIYKAYPDSAKKVLNRIAACHGGQLNDSRWGKRMTGDGVEAQAINQLFHLAVKQCLQNRVMPAHNLSLFRNRYNQQFELF